jgi:hypothetical protein
MIGCGRVKSKASPHTKWRLTFTVHIRMIRLLRHLLTVLRDFLCEKINVAWTVSFE